MGITTAWANYKKQTLFTNMKIQQKNLLCNKKYRQGINPMGLSAPWVK